MLGRDNTQVDTFAQERQTSAGSAEKSTISKYITTEDKSFNHTFRTARTKNCQQCKHLAGSWSNS